MKLEFKVTKTDYETFYKQHFVNINNLTQVNIGDGVICIKFHYTSNQLICILYPSH